VVLLIFDRTNITQHDKWIKHGISIWNSKELHIKDLIAKALLCTDEKTSMYRVEKTFLLIGSAISYSVILGNNSCRFDNKINFCLHTRYGVLDNLYVKDEIPLPPADETPIHGNYSGSYARVGSLVTRVLNWSMVLFMSYGLKNKSYLLYLKPDLEFFFSSSPILVCSSGRNTGRNVERNIGRNIKANKQF
jgi:hypothetical protein